MDNSRSGTNAGGSRLFAGFSVFQEGQVFGLAIDPDDVVIWPVSYGRLKSHLHKVRKVALHHAVQHPGRQRAFRAFVATSSDDAGRASPAVGEFHPDA